MWPLEVSIICLTNPVGKCVNLYTKKTQKNTMVIAEMLFCNMFVSF